MQIFKPGRGLLLLALFLICFGNLAVAEVASFAEAKQLSATSGKPIFFEYYRSDCEYCERSEREAQQNINVVRALLQVVHYHCNVKEGDGVELAEKYDVGHTYPVFLLADSSGEPIARWTGFSSGDRLITNLSTKLKDLTTIAERETRLAAGGKLNDALHLAGYYADATRYAESVAAYRKAQELIGSRGDYSYQIFYQSANAAWNDMIPFSEMLSAADVALASAKVNRMNKFKVVELLARVARKFETTDVLAPYLERGIKLAGEGKDPKTREKLANFMADRALHVDGDINRAVLIKKEGYDAGWGGRPDLSFGFARWCLERKINLPEAEKYCRQAGAAIFDEKSKAQIYAKLGEILAAQGKYSAAVDALLIAVENHPSRDLYHTQLKEYNDSLEVRQ